MIKAYLAPPIAGINTYTLAEYPLAWFECTNADGVQGVKINIEKKEDNQYKVKATGEMKFSNEDKDFILEHLITGSAPAYIPDSYVWIKLYDDCCGEVIFQGHITADLVSWCSDDCFIKCNAKEYTKRTDAFNFIKNSVIDYRDVDVLDIPYRKRFDAGSKRYHPSPNLKDLLIKNLAINNIAFSSSILANTRLNQWTGDNYQDLNGINPYTQTYLVNADFEQGNKTTGGAFINNNKMIDTIKGLLDKLKDVYNADYWIREIGGVKTLEFERKDYFNYYADIWGDLTNKNVCFEIDEKSRYAFFEGKWQKNIGNDSDDKHMYLVYNNIVEWNQPNNPTQSGRKAVNLAFSYAEIDNVDDNDIPTGFDDLNLDQTGLLSAPTLVISQTAPNRGLQATFYRMRNTTNVTSSPMYDSFPYDVKALEYNSPYWFSNEGWFKKYDANWPLPLIPYVYGLYDNFHFIDNPKNLPNGRGYYSKNRKYGLKWNYEIEFDCDMFLTFNETSGVELSIFGQNVTAMIESAEFDFKKRTLKLKGKV